MLDILFGLFNFFLKGIWCIRAEEVGPPLICFSLAFSSSYSTDKLLHAHLWPQRNSIMSIIITWLNSSRWCVSNLLCRTSWWLAFEQATCQGPTSNATMLDNLYDWVQNSQLDRRIKQTMLRRLIMLELDPFAPITKLPIANVLLCVCKLYNKWSDTVVAQLFSIRSGIHHVANLLEQMFC